MENKAIENVLDQLIDKAAEQIRKEIDNSKIEEVEQVEFSEEHKKKMKQIFKQCRREENKEKLSKLNFHVPKAAAAAVIVLVSIFAIVGSVGAWKESLVNYVLKIQDKYGKTMSECNTNFYYYDNLYFGYLPEGYEFEKEMNFKTERSIFFSNLKTKKYIVLSEGNNLSAIKINTEECTVLEEIKIDNKDAIYAETEYEKIIYWEEESGAYTVYSNTGKSDLIKVVEKLEILKK